MPLLTLSGGQASVLTDHGPKLLPLTVVCRKPGPTQFFDAEAYRVEFGFAFAGSTLTALSAYNLANILCGNLIGRPDALPPTMDEVAQAVATVSLNYMKEICQIGGAGSLFRAILFGHCPSTRQALAFQFEPSLATGSLTLDVRKQVLGPTEVVIIGDNPGRLSDRIQSIRATSSPEDLGFKDAPITALRSLIQEGSIASVGGAVQQAWSVGYKLNIIATAEFVAPRPPSPRNVGMFVLGFDTYEMQTIGSF